MSMSFLKKLTLIFMPLWLLMAPSAASARHFFVAPTARAGGSGADSTSAMTLNSFNNMASAAAGDTALLLGGLHLRIMPNQTPANVGTLAAPIVYKGFSGNPADVTVGLVSESGSRADSNIVIRDVTINGSLQIIGNTQLARWKVINCNILGNVALRYLRDSKIDSCIVVNGSNTSSALNTNANSNPTATLADTALYTRRDTISNTTMTFSSIYDSSPSGTTVNAMSGFDHYFYRLRMLVSSASGTDASTRAMRYMYARGIVTKNCYFEFTNNFTGFGNETMTFSLKDGAKWLVFDTDTLIMKGNGFASPNNTYPWIDLAQNESDNNVPPSIKSTEGIGGNIWRNCYIANRTTATYGVTMYTAGVDGDSLVNNTIISNASPFTVGGYAGDGMIV